MSRITRARFDLVEQHENSSDASDGPKCAHRVRVVQLSRGQGRQDLGVGTAVVSCSRPGRTSEDQGHPSGTVTTWTLPPWLACLPRAVLLAGVARDAGALFTRRGTRSG
jgi:hypothetical protein